MRSDNESLQRFAVGAGGCEVVAKRRGRSGRTVFTASRIRVPYTFTPELLTIPGVDEPGLPLLDHWVVDKVGLVGPPRRSAKRFTIGAYGSRRLRVIFAIVLWLEGGYVVVAQVTSFFGPKYSFGNIPNPARQETVGELHRHDLFQHTRLLTGNVESDFFDLRDMFWIRCVSNRSYQLGSSMSSMQRICKGKRTSTIFARATA